MNINIAKLFPDLISIDGHLVKESGDHIVYGLTLDSTPNAVYCYGFCIPTFSEPMMLHASYSKRIFLYDRNGEEEISYINGKIRYLFSEVLNWSTMDGFISEFGSRASSLDPRHRRCIALCLFKLGRFSECISLSKISTSHDSFDEIEFKEFEEFVSFVECNRIDLAELILRRWTILGRSLILRSST